MTLVMFTQGETGNDDPTVVVRVNPPTLDKPFRFEFDVPQTTATAELGFAFQGIQLGLPTDGRWVVTVQARGGGKPVSIPLNVDSFVQRPAVANP
jgi:hypothetical protein